MEIDVFAGSRVGPQNTQTEPLLSERQLNVREQETAPSVGPPQLAAVSQRPSVQAFLMIRAAELPPLSTVRGRREIKETTKSIFVVWKGLDGAAVDQVPPVRRGSRVLVTY